MLYLQLDLINLCFPGEPAVFAFQRGSGVLSVCQYPFPSEAVQFSGQLHLYGFVREVGNNQQRFAGALRRYITI